VLFDPAPPAHTLVGVAQEKLTVAVHLWRVAAARELEVGDLGSRVGKPGKHRIERAVAKHFGHDAESHVADPASSRHSRASAKASVLRCGGLVQETDRVRFPRVSGSREAAGSLK
jgi:hypothetical protein